MTLRDFLDYLERALHPHAPDGELPEDWTKFRRDCEGREEAGREEFGDAYLTRDNAAEGLEEASDGCNYAYFAAERARLEQDGDYDDALQLAVIAAHHFFQAHQALAKLRDKPS